MFWTSVLDFHLKALLDNAYGNPRKKKLVEHWLNGSESKSVMVMQEDFPTDPLLLTFKPDSWHALVLDDGQNPRSDVALVSTHIALIALTGEFWSFVLGMSRGSLKLPLLFRNPRDHYYAMKIFLGRLR
jgi:hypothetical protein